MRILWATLLGSFLLSATTWETDFEKAKQRAAVEHHFILLNFSGSDWCGPCISLRREIFEELGIEITVIGLLRIDAIPYIAEEPGPYRLDFYFRCAPRNGFAALRQSLGSGLAKPRSPEIRQVRFVPLTNLTQYDLFSADLRFLTKDLPRHEPTLAISKND